MHGSSSLRAWWAQRPAAAGAAVMATGIIGVGLRLAGYGTLSRIALVLSGVAWAVLAVDFAARLLVQRERWRAEASTPCALTAVAATAVLGTGLADLDRPVLAEALLALAVLLWPVLLFDVVRHWGRRMPGAVFLCCVATQALAVLGATLARTEGVAWLAHTALVLFWLGLVLYCVALTRFGPREVLEGAGDHWVTGGALAISALAGSRLYAAEGGGLYLWNADDRDVLRGVTVALLTLSLVGYAVLLVGEVVRPRLGHDVRRWATVFPLGMTATAVLSVADALDLPGLKGLGQVLLWIAVAAWLVVAAGAVTAARRALGAGGGGSPGE
ncbi:MULTISPECIES: tellurite resistance/C4-dicarboxylate transporter family protein [unclassified Streptomyces]|uniref:tellurite resistance/C4-dicarboxylate transporter family protein n=1 Tax=unclassified Streptomyces TaxID=2593676 RepID=UPI0037F5392A